MLKVLRARQIEAGPQKPDRRSAYIEWNYDAELFAFNARLQENFDDTLLRTALTHPSHVFLQQQQHNGTYYKFKNEEPGIISETSYF